MGSAHERVYEGVDLALVIQRNRWPKRIGVSLEVSSVDCFIKTAKIPGHAHKFAEVARDGSVPTILIEGSNAAALTVVLIAAKNLHLGIALRQEWERNSAQEKYKRESLSHWIILKNLDLFLACFATAQS
jgi:hypothetical protein